MVQLHDELNSESDSCNKADEVSFVTRIFNWVFIPTNRHLWFQVILQLSLVSIKCQRLRGFVWKTHFVHLCVCRHYFLRFCWDRLQKLCTYESLDSRFSMEIYIQQLLFGTNEIEEEWSDSRSNCTHMCTLSSLCQVGVLTVSTDLIHRISLWAQQISTTKAAENDRQCDACKQPVSQSEAEFICQLMLKFGFNSRLMFFVKLFVQCLARNMVVIVCRTERVTATCAMHIFPIRATQMSEMKQYTHTCST